MAWYEEYIGRPWGAVPDPPRSFTCGELVRHIMRERHGIHMPEILANAAVLRECLRDIRNPARYGLHPLPAGERPREYDAAYLVRVSREDHVGLGVETGEGLMILHCQPGAGVTLDRPAELLGMGYRRIDWYRHHLLGGASCPG